MTDKKTEKLLNPDKGLKTAVMVGYAAAFFVKVLFVFTAALFLSHTPFWWLNFLLLAIFYHFVVSFVYQWREETRKRKEDQTMDRIVEGFIEAVARAKEKADAEEAAAKAKVDE